MTLRPEFWKLPIDKLKQDEWEALCDGCAKCCLHKLEDDADGEVYYTDIACHYLNLKQCHCGDYTRRHQNVPDCIAFTAQDLKHMSWLPDTCAYLLRYRGEPLYDWHYLLSGSRESIHQAGESIRDFAITDSGQDVEDHIIYFKP